VSIWIAQTLGFYGFNSWVPTLLTEHGFSIVRSLEQASVMQIGAVPGAWIAASISDRWERKSLIAIVAIVIAACGMIYGLSFRTSTIVVFAPLIVANAILLEAALSYLGAGVQAPSPSWGTMIADGTRLMPGAIHLVLVPGILLVLTVLSVNVFAEAVRDVLDPKATDRRSIPHPGHTVGSPIGQRGRL